MEIEDVLKRDVDNVIWVLVDVCKDHDIFYWLTMKGNVVSDRAVNFEIFEHDHVLL